MNEKVKSLMEKYESCDVDLINFLKKIGVKLKEDLNIPLLKAAFTHKSFSNDVHKKVPSNERLEFL
jgi:dsRNA-specific ribonuclease